MVHKRQVMSNMIFIQNMLLMIPVFGSACNLVLSSVIINQVQSSDRMFIILTMIASVLGMYPYWACFMLLIDRNLHKGLMYASLTISSIIASIALAIRRKTADNELIGRILSTMWIILIANVVFFGVFLIIMLTIEFSVVGPK